MRKQMKYGLPVIIVLLMMLLAVPVYAVSKPGKSSPIGKIQKQGAGKFKEPTTAILTETEKRNCLQLLSDRTMSPVRSGLRAVNRLNC